MIGLWWIFITHWMKDELRKQKEKSALTWSNEGGFFLLLRVHSLFFIGWIYFIHLLIQHSFVIRNHGSLLLTLTIENNLISSSLLQRWTTTPRQTKNKDYIVVCANKRYFQVIHQKRKDSNVSLVHLSFSVILVNSGCRFIIIPSTCL
jgi:hypothetical protein